MDKITISNPERITEGGLTNVYFCKVYLPNLAKTNPIYADSPDEATKNANNFVEIYLREKINGIESYLKEKDVRKKLTEELDWARRELIRHNEKK